MNETVKRHADVLFLILVVLLIGGANLFWTSHAVSVSKAGLQRQAAREQALQQRTGELIEQKLCATLIPLEPLAGLVAPAGNPAANPSRAYEQHLTRLLQPLAQLGPDLGCRKDTP